MTAPMDAREAAIAAASEMHEADYDAARMAYIEASRAADAAFRASIADIFREYPTTTKETPLQPLRRSRKPWTSRPLTRLPLRHESSPAPRFRAANANLAMAQDALEALDQEFREWRKANPDVPAN